jgi:hypothetical protein
MPQNTVRGFTDLRGESGRRTRTSRCVAKETRWKGRASLKHGLKRRDMIAGLGMYHHLFLLSPTDTPLYSLTHVSAKPAPNAASPLSSNLPSWSTSAFAGTLTALSGASSANQHGQPGGVSRVGGGQDRHVIQMIANASLDVIEDVMRKENAMWVCVRADVRSLG